MRVLITTSGVGSRLGDLTQYTNKALVRVGKKPAISYIIESYPKDTDFIITTGYFGEHIKEFLSLAYPGFNFSFVDINPFEGQGSSLGYSMLCAREYLQCPFIFHACDTIIDTKIDEITGNWIAGAKIGSSSQYRTFSVLNNRVQKIYDKGEKDYDFEYLGICSILNYERFWEILDKKCDPMNSSISDCDVLAEMIQEYDFSYKTFGWLDIGNLDSLQEAREKITDKFELLDKNDESIFIFNDSCIKFFSNIDICQNRVQRAQILEGKVPRVIESTNHFYKYEYINGDLFSEVVNKNNFSLLLDFAIENLWIKIENKSDEFYNICKSFYFDKTFERINKFHKQNNLIDTEHIINGLNIPKISNIMKKIDESWLCNIDPTGFHGDFILDNIIIDNEKITLLDWRQDFGGEINRGDMYYDLGKLNHNLTVNHGIVGQGKFSTQQISENNFIVDIFKKDVLVEAQDILHNKILQLGWDLKKVKVLSGIIWLNMAPLHDRSFGLFLYLFGKYTLWKELNEFE